MFLRSLVFTTFLASLATAEVLNPGASLPSTSKAGQRLLSKARALNDADRDFTWVAKYDIKYKGCSSLVQFRGEEGGGGGDGEGFLYTQNMVKFSLCPSDESCSECRSGAEYVINMMDFVQAYTEYKQELQEQMCEYIAENCNCENANDDQACENNCYSSAGMDVCIENENDNGQEEFQIEEYLECKEMEAQNNNNNNNQQQYFIGPYCSAADGWSIHLGIFYDEGCSSRGDSDIFSTYNYGAELPYSSEPIVESDCISCMQVDDDQNNNNNQNQNNNYYYQELEVNEFCQALYEPAAKCERGIDTYYPDTSACEYIENILPKLESAIRSKSTSKSSGSGDHTTSKVLSWVFAVTTVMFAGYAYFLYGKLARSNVNLSGGDGAMA